MSETPRGSWGCEERVDAPTSYNSRWHLDVRAEFGSDSGQAVDLTRNSWLQPYLVWVKPLLDMENRFGLLLTVSRGVRLERRIIDYL